MAVLEDIRKKGGIVVSIIIGIALFAFIIGDFLPGGRKNRGGGRNFDIAKVGSNTLTYPEYESKIEEMTNMYKQRTGQGSVDERTADMIREQAWQTIINETLMQQQYNRIGLTVSPEELMDIIQGPNPSPIIRQNFSNPQTGEFDRSFLFNFLRTKNQDPMYSQQWNLLEKSLLDERYMQKFNGLVGKGIFVPDFMAENENREINKKVDFDYIVQNYTTIPDSAIKVTKDDLKAYYAKHKKQWEQTASRDIEYVVFSIVPSDDDRAAAQAWIDKIKPEFEQAADPMQFVRLNSRISPDMRFMTHEQLPVQVADLFNAEAGALIGPYQEGEILKLVRLAKIENRPDSVKMRQIIIVPKQQSQTSAQEIITLSDSIKTAIEKGANFAVLAAKYSADKSATSTNENWIHESDMQAGSIMETLFSMKKGEVTKMETAQGIYIIQVTERGEEVKKVQIATLQHNILPSSRTEQIIYSQASKFAIENRSEKQFDDAATAQNLNKRVANYLGENDRQIPGLSSARSIVRWVYNAKQGEVSDVFNVNNAYVVAVLKNIRKKGVAPIKQVATEINIAVHREKKAALIAANLSESVKNAQSFSDLASTLKFPIGTASAITFSAFSIPGAGVEPQLIASATNMEEGNISQPVEGVNGVYLFTVKQITESEEGGKEQSKERLSVTYANRSMSESVQALHKAANIEDWRSKFY